jgi:predicted MPP superfamily phosphohydrolase
MRALTSKNRSICVFSDPHQDYRKVQYILQKEHADYYICLGDWFDSHFQDKPEDVEQTAKLIKNLVFQPNFITLLGNHDVSHLYFRLNKHTWCSGYSTTKDDIIDKVWGDARQNIIDKFQWFIYIDDFLCTHAGLSQYHLKPNQDLSRNSMIDWLSREVKETHTALASGSPYWIFKAGIARGGDFSVGGLTWLDSSEINPIPGLRQISGHNPGKNVRSALNTETDPNKMQHILIDCFLKQYLVIQNKKITIKNYADL